MPLPKTRNDRLIDWLWLFIVCGRYLLLSWFGWRNLFCFKSGDLGDPAQELEVLHILQAEVWNYSHRERVGLQNRGLLTIVTVVVCNRHFWHTETVLSVQLVQHELLNQIQLQLRRWPFLFGIFAFLLLFLRVNLRLSWFPWEWLQFSHNLLSTVESESLLRFGYLTVFFEN